MQRRSFISITGAAILALGAPRAFLEACTKPMQPALQTAGYLRSRSVYIDVHAKNKNGDSSMANPFKSFNQAGPFKASDTIYIMPGVYKKQTLVAGKAKVRFTKPEKTALYNNVFIGGRWKALIPMRKKYNY